MIIIQLIAGMCVNLGRLSTLLVIPETEERFWFSLTLGSSSVYSIRHRPDQKPSGYG